MKATIQCAMCRVTLEYEETGTVDTMPDGYFLNNSLREWICDECGSCSICGTTLEKEPEKRGVHAKPCKDCELASEGKSDYQEM